MHDPLDDLPPAMCPAPRPTTTIVADEFVSRDDLAALVRDGRVRIDGAIAHVDGTSHLLREAVRVLGSASHETDPYGFTGKADTLAAFLQRGFVLSAERIALGRFVYDVEYGYLPQPLRNGPDESGVNPVVR